VGLFYNDTAISKDPLDSAQQAKLAIFGSLLAGILAQRLARQPLDRGGPPVPKTSRFIHKVLYDLDHDPQLSGEQLARRFRVSAGHLARTFKAEVGTSLVDYRNRLRLERFFAAMQAGRISIQEAAIQAGFGSYAQFNRVHRQLTGLAPRENSSNGGAGEE
jgi:transcriptional regulator GlxA family with amidase domain